MLNIVDNKYYLSKLFRSDKQTEQSEQQAWNLIWENEKNEELKRVNLLSTANNEYYILRSFKSDRNAEQSE